MSSALLRTSALRGSTFRRLVSAARSGGGGLAVRRPVSLPPCSLRRHVHSGTPGDQLPKSPDEKINALLEKIKATRATSFPNDVAVDIFSSSMLARQELYMKQLSRSWTTGSVLVSGGFVGYYISKSENGNDKARDGK